MSDRIPDDEVLLRGIREEHVAFVGGDRGYAITDQAFLLSKRGAAESEPYLSVPGSKVLSPTHLR